jgi:hypothetical protein
MAFGIDDAIAVGLKIINKFIPDPEVKAKAESELRASLIAWDSGQIEVNKAEASSGITMAATWRPAIGWICAIGLAYQFLFVPIIGWVAQLICGANIPMPPNLSDMLWELMFGMLGLSGLRTFEKIKGVMK